MAEAADDWAPVGQASPQDDWKPVVATKEPPAPSIESVAGSEGVLPGPMPPVPQAFVDRVVKGAAISSIMSKAVEGWQEGLGAEPVTGVSDETRQQMIDMGLIHDPAKGGPGPIHLFNEAMIFPTAKAFETLMRGVNAGVHGAAGAVGQIVDEVNGYGEGGDLGGEGSKAKREVINAGNWALIEAGFGRFARPSPAADHVIGTLPREADFKNAAEVIRPRAEPPISDADLLSNVSKWTSGMSGGAKVELLPQAVERFGTPLPQETKFYRGEWPGRPEFADEKGTVSVSDFAGGKTFSMMRNDAILEDIAAGDGGKLPISEIVVPPGVKVFDASRFAGENAGELEQMLPPGRFTKIGERLEPFEFAAETGNHHISTYRFEPFDPTPVRLQQLWQEKGLHPSEVAHDAQTDAFLRHDLTAKGVEVETPKEAVDTLPGVPHSLGAEVTSLPPDVPPSVQPLQQPGKLTAAMQSGADRLFDIGKDMQMLVAPMATGTNASMAIAKDFANTMRRNRWEWSRTDADIAKRFTPEQRTRMWNAADEESVARQLAESTEHQGLITLEPAERAAVEELQTRAQVAWARARDLGMVEGEGLPAYTPRMVINASSALSGDTAIPLNGIGLNLRTRTSQMMHRAYMTAEETEAAMKKGLGADVEIARDIRALPLATGKLEDAIAGRSLIENIKDYGKRTGSDTVVEGAIPAGSDTKWFTLDHPAFRTWRPKLSDGGVVKDAEGHIVFEQVPLYVHGDFEGPLRAVLTQRSGPTYKAMMELKGKTMSLIMNSPMIHNAVEFGRAFPAMPTRIFKAYFDGNRAKNDVAIMTEAIDNGLVPIGKRFFKQDIDSIMEAPDLTPGRSWTSKVLAAVPGLFDEAAGTAVKRAVDKAGDFWHNTLLWDRIADLQMGIYVNMRGDMLAKGVDAQTSSRVAAHFANRYAGALPKEAMSDAATKFSNMILFSRTFTMGNLGVMKDMLTGLPKDVMAQIERDMGVVDPKAKGYALSMARRKAFSTVMLDIGLLYVGNSVLQSALNVMLGDSTIDQEAHGYARRFREVTNEARATHLLSLLQPFDLAEKLSATADNEPGKKDRLKIGYAKDGTAIYARNPVGKIGEEFIGYLTGPIDMLRKKQGTIARPIMGVLSNDKGFGRKIYDPTAETPAQYANNMWEIIKHFGKSQIPEGQINALSDLVKGEGDQGVNAKAAFGPLVGVTFSKGAPGGPAVGEMYHARAQHEYQVNSALPDIRKQIVRGDVAGAQKAMTELGIAPGLQRFYIRTSQNPATRLSSRALQDFYRTASPRQRERMENLRSPGPLTPDQ